MNNQNPNNTTLVDVLEAVNNASTETDKHLKNIKDEITTIKSTMVTKAYLDDKLANLKGDLTILMRKEDTKLKALVEILEEKKVLNPEDKKRIFSLEPFPELSL